MTAVLALSLWALTSSAGVVPPAAHAEGQLDLSNGAVTQTHAAAQPRLLAALRSKIPLNPVMVSGDPYLTGRDKKPSASPPATVCGVRFEKDQVHYSLFTFGSAVAARRAGAAVTHFGSCGTCSTLQDLAVYLEKPDLTAPVRSCVISASEARSLRCLEALGFSSPCAQTWYYDAQNTRRECFWVCVVSWIEGAEPRRADGQLNDCLQCDEDRSGPIFRAAAGRTRRNSGIYSSIPRLSHEIAPLVHDYVPDLSRP